MSTLISHAARRTLLPALLVSYTFLGCGFAQAEEPKFDVTWSMPSFGGDSKKINAVAHNSEITILDVVVNRGNCPNTFNLNKSKPVKLGFGQSLAFYTHGGCEILEVTLKTDKGDMTYSFN